MKQNCTDFLPPYLRLLGKVRRTGHYYRWVAGRLRRRGQAEADQRLLAQAESVERNARDMDYIFERGSFVLTLDQKAKLMAETQTHNRRAPHEAQLADIPTTCQN